MHRLDLAENDAEEWSDHPTAEQSASKNVTSVKKLHGEDKLLPCCKTYSTPPPRKNHLITSPSRRERGGSGTVRADNTTRPMICQTKHMIVN
jgi:hypothetical protein